MVSTGRRGWRIAASCRRGCRARVSVDFGGRASLARSPADPASARTIPASDAAPAPPRQVVHPSLPSVVRLGLPSCILIHCSAPVQRSGPAEQYDGHSGASVAGGDTGDHGPDVVGKQATLVDVVIAEMLPSVDARTVQVMEQTHRGLDP
jgi:hypothetical protein